MLDRIKNLKEKFARDISSIKTLPELENLKIQYMSRKGEVADLFNFMKDVTPEERPQIGKSLNELKLSVNTEIEKTFSRLQMKSTDSQLDLTFFTFKIKKGSV